MTCSVFIFLVYKTIKYTTSHILPHTNEANTFIDVIDDCSSTRMKRIYLLLETINDATTAVNERIEQIEKAGGIITDIKFQPRPPPSSRMIFCIIYDIPADPGVK